MPVFTLRVVRPIRLLAFMILAALITIGGPQDAGGESLRVTIGRISEKPREHFLRMRALADHLAAELASDGVTGVDVVLVDSLEEMRELMASGRVDIISETAFMALSLVESGVAEMVLREWKQGVPEYHTLFFARADAGIETIDDLSGRTIAFEDPGSTSAYLIPRAVLENAEFDLTPLERPNDPIPDGSIGYVFADGEINVVAWVHRRIADAGVVSNLDWENDDETPLFLRDDLTIIHETQPIIRSLLLMRTDLDPAMKDRISEILQTMHRSEAGRRALRRYFSVSRYDEIEDADAAGLGLVRQILHRNEPE